MNTKSTNGKNTSGGKSEGYRLFANRIFARFLRTRRFFQGVSLTGRSGSLVSDWSEDRTPRRTRIFSQSCLCSALDSSLDTDMRACGS